MSNTKLGKRKRSAAKYAEYNKVLKDNMIAQRDGTNCGQGIAMKQAGKQAKTNRSATNRNPVGTLPSEMKCRFFHRDFCTKIGHATARTASCTINRKLKRTKQSS